MPPARAGGSACQCHGSPRVGEPIARQLGGDLALEMLVRRAVVALRQRRALAGLALARRRAAAGDAAVEGARLDLALDEPDRRRDALAHGPGDLRLARDREVAADVLEERPVGLREVERVLGEALHRLLASL